MAPCGVPFLGKVLIHPKVAKSPNYRKGN
jgi:hypothetical protein